MGKHLKIIGRGFVFSVAFFALVISLSIIMLGPFGLFAHYDNSLFLYLYTPHMIGGCYLVGRDE